MKYYIEPHSRDEHQLLTNQGHLIVKTPDTNSYESRSKSDTLVKTNCLYFFAWEHRWSNTTQSGVAFVGDIPQVGLETSSRPHSARTISYKHTHMWACSCPHKLANQTKWIRATPLNKNVARSLMTGGGGTRMNVNATNIVQHRKMRVACMHKVTRSEFFTISLITNLRIREFPHCYTWVRGKRKKLKCKVLQGSSVPTVHFQPCSLSVKFRFGVKGLQMEKAYNLK